MSCIQLRTACEADLRMDDSFNELIYFPWGGAEGGNSIAPKDGGLTLCQ